MSNLKDVARDANVSIATVSRVLNRDPNLSVADTTRERVFQSAKKLNYLPSSKRKQTMSEASPKLSIGLIIFCSKDHEYEDEYFMSIRRGIESASVKLGFTISSVIRLGQDSIEETNFTDLEGLIVVGNISGSIVEQIYAQHDRVVFVDESPRTDLFDSVTSDFFGAATQLMEYMFSMGHKNIGYLGGNEITHTPSHESDLGIIENIEKMRFIPYKRVMEKRGLYNPQHVYIGDWSTDAGYQLMKQAIKKGNFPSAFLIASDPIAIGAIRALHEEGLNVPNDVSITSFNDIEIAKYVNPPLTTAKIYSEQMGKSAVKLLSERIEGREVPAKIIHPCRIEYRESCVPIKEHRGDSVEV
ncbi:transcriptional regulator [Salipaludibacillus keqinensis]|uniref:Transcriptional regulator n=1 Tax=Salipaludibacillus keqinensis TaxID=2045207 RepID=A0A323TDB6_9BACI|nr:LacI family DNA-binding transcriptional regulator [Salipaludibacillus keqinensis]PYZ92750.1 transcriptional regulator [Salipaludibacillus keqinensis]